MASEIFFSPSTPLPLTFMLGEPRVRLELSHLFRDIGAYARCRLEPLEEFGRDFRVIGLNNIHIIPHSIGHDPDHRFILDNEYPPDKLRALMLALLPISSTHFITDNKGFLGRGCYVEGREIALSAVRKYNLPFHRARSSVEGGNCYVFFNPQGLPRAIVGVHSIALTLVGLDQQKYFSKHQEEFNAAIAAVGSPSEDAIHRARNAILFSAFSMGILQPSVFEDKITLPLTEYDRRTYHNEARVLEAKASIASQVIARDLQVPLDDIAFVPQNGFHIDMEMFVAPDGATVYIDTASSRPDTLAAASEELERIGCRVIPVQGVHTVNEQSINFMNGIFVSTPSGPFYITNGTGNDDESLRLRQCFQQSIGFSTAFLNETQKILTDLEGGIHCLTWERLEFATPLDIVISYLAAMPLPEARLRAEIGDTLALLDTPLAEPQKKDSTTSGVKRKLLTAADTHATPSSKKGCTNPTDSS